MIKTFEDWWRLLPPTLKDLILSDTRVFGLLEEAFRAGKLAERDRQKELKNWLRSPK